MKFGKRIGVGRGLTLSEQRFAQEYVRLQNATKAALAAYPDIKPATARSKGSRMLDQPSIRQEIVRICREDAMITPYMMAEVMKRWIQGKDGYLAHKWFETLMNMTEGRMPGDEAGGAEVHNHKHLHLENVSDAEKKFYLLHGRFPTAGELEGAQ